MAKINFGNYYRVVNNNSNKSYTASNIQLNGENINLWEGYDYNSNHFNELLKNFKFEEAADYAEQFVMNDTKEQTYRESEIENLRRNGRIFNAVFAKASNKDEKEALAFSMSVFSERGIDSLIGDNTYANAYSDLKTELGGKDATKIKISFAPKKQYLFDDNLDWLVKDNEHDIQDFYDRTGLDEDSLKLAGIDVTKEKGNDVLIFNKTNKYSDYILYNLANIDNSGISYYTGRSHKPKYITIEGLDDKNQIIDDPLERNYDIVYNAQRLINDSKNIADKFLEPINEDQVYSSTIGAFLEDGMEDIRKQKAQGLITGAEYKRMMEERYSDVTGVLKSLGSSNYHIYSDAWNENEDETMVELSNKQRHWAIDMITSSDDYSLNSMISHGQIGTLVTIYATPEDKKNIDIDDTPEDRVKGRRYSFFIPGLFHEKAQQAINSDSRTRAEQEFNDIQRYSSYFRTVDKKELSHVGGNVFEYDGKPVSAEEAKIIINKNMTIKDASRAIRQGFTDANGNINKPLAEQYAKSIAFNSVNELFPETPFMLLDYTNFGIDDLFNMRSVNGNVEASYKQFINQSVYDKILEAYSIYDLIMEDINKYQ